MHLKIYHFTSVCQIKLTSCFAHNHDIQSGRTVDCDTSTLAYLVQLVFHSWFQRICLLIGWFISRLCIEFEEIRDHFSQPPWGGPKSKSGLRFALTWSLTGQGYLGQVHSKKVAPIELKMVPAVLKHKITHMVQISAQSEQLRQRYDCFYWFFEKTQLRYVSSRSWNFVPGVHPSLVHSQNLSEPIGHSDGGQKRFRTAVRCEPRQAGRRWICNL